MFPTGLDRASASLFGLALFGVTLFLAASLGGAIDVVDGTSFPLLFAALAAVVVAPWIVAIRRGRVDVFEPILFHSIFVAMVVIALFDRVHLQEWQWQYEEISYGYVEGFTIFGLAYLAFFTSVLFGYYVIGGRYCASISIRWLPSVPAAENYPVRAARWLGIAYVGIGTASYLVLLRTGVPGGDVLYIYTTGVSRAEIFAEQTHLLIGSFLIYIGYFVWLTAKLAERKFLRVRDFFPVPVIMAVFVTLGGRGRVFGILLTAFVVFYYAYRFEVVRTEGLVSRVLRAIPMPIAAALLTLLGIAAGAIVTVLGGIREGRTPAEAVEDVELTSILTAGVQNTKIDTFLLLTEFVPGELDFYYGSFYARAALNYVPSEYWDSKPVLTVGALIRRMFRPEQSGGRTVGQLGDYYINFGYPGILVMGVLLGVLFSVMYRGLRRNRDSPFAILVYAFLLTSIGQAGLTNNGLETLLFELGALVPLLVVYHAQRIVRG